jgi:hypothetical protein
VKAGKGVSCNEMAEMLFDFVLESMERLGDGLWAANWSRFDKINTFTI